MKRLAASSPRIAPESKNSCASKNQNTPRCQFPRYSNNNSHNRITNDDNNNNDNNNNNNNNKNKNHDNHNNNGSSKTRMIRITARIIRHTSSNDNK